MPRSHALVLTSFGGGNALSPFRAAALLRRLQAVAPTVSSLTARHVHWVASTDALDRATTDTVARLLTYGPAAGPAAPGPANATVVVAPAPGHPLAVGVQGHRHRPQLRRRRAPGRAGRRVHPRLRSPLTGTDVGGLRRPAARPDDRDGAASRAPTAAALFDEREAEPMAHVDVLGRGRAALEEAERRLRARAVRRRDRLPGRRLRRRCGRNPTDVELMMFAQANSEHCRHKIFNADFVVDGGRRPARCSG